MAITETRPETTTLETHVNPWGRDDEYPSFVRSLGSSDHKTIGRAFVGFSLLFGVAAWLVAALSSLHDIEDVDVISDDHVFQVFTIGRIGLVFLFAIPLLLGLAIYLVPLQVGANTVAFPRAAATAFWGWLLGSVLLIISYASDGGIGGGRSDSIDLAYLAWAVVILALLLGAVCVATTLITLRTPGLRLDRVPFFSWSMLVSCSLLLVSLPVLLANMLLIYLDHRLGRPSDFGVGLNQWPQVVWSFQQPQVFVYAIPVLGVVGDITTTMFGVRQKNRGVVFAGIAAFGILSFGAWAQSFFNDDVSTQWLYIGMGFAILLPMFVVLGGFGTSLREGKPRINAPVAGALLAMPLLLLAGVASALYVIEPFDLQTRPYTQYAVLALVLGALTVAGAAGLAYWAPKIWGRNANNGAAYLAVLAGFAGSGLAGLVLLINGFQADSSDFLNGVAVAGFVLLAGAVLLAILSVVGRGGTAADDPWGGLTLEWATSSPPPLGNFAELAEVTSPEPLLDWREPATEKASS